MASHNIAVFQTVRACMTGDLDFVGPAKESIKIPQNVSDGRYISSNNKHFIGCSSYRRLLVAPRVIKYTFPTMWMYVGPRCVKSITKEMHPMRRGPLRSLAAVGEGVP